MHVVLRARTHTRTLVRRHGTNHVETRKGGRKKNERKKNEGRKGENFTQNGKGDVMPWISCVVG